MVDYREILKLQLLGHHESAGQLIDQMPEDEDRSDLVAATFAILVSQRFEDDSSAAAVQNFIDEARENYADAHPPFKPLTAVALIRTVIDPDANESLLNEVKPEDHLPTQLLISRKIVAESAELATKIDDVLSDAVAIEQMWASEPS